MPRITHNWLRLLLALVMAVLSVAQAPAGAYASDMKMTGTGHHTGAMSHGGHMVMGEYAQPACEHCDTADQGCGADCGLCTAMILPEAAVLGAVRPSSPPPLAETSEVSGHPYQLFRPPRS